MLEIEKLEREWRRYKLKRLSPWIFSVSTLLLVSIAYLLWFDTDKPLITDKNIQTTEKKEFLGYDTIEKSVTKNVSRAPVSNNSPSTILSKPLEKGSQPSTQKKDSSVILNPDTEFLNSFSDSGSLKNRSTSYLRKMKEHNSETSSYKNRQTVKAKKEKGLTASSKKENGSGTLIIQSSKTNNTLAYLIKRFNEKRDPKLASYIAQSLYKKANYEEAVKWSVMANSLDPSSEDTWLVFARSKVKLGQKEEAIRALRTYLNQYTSKNVKSFLRSLEQGR